MKHARKVALAAVAAAAFLGSALHAATLNVTTGAGWQSDFLAVSQATMDTNKLLSADTVVASLVSFNAGVPEFTGAPAPVGAHQYNPGAPNGAWVNSNTTTYGGNWIGYKNGTNGANNTANLATQNDVGYYMFSQDYSFAPGFNLVTFAAGLGTGKGFASDNRVVGIFINGVKINFVQNGIANNAAPTGLTYEMTYGSITGSTAVNTTGPNVRVTFIVENNNPTGTANGNPAGLLVDGQLSASQAPVIPLPAAVWGGLGLMGLIAGQRMRRSA